MKNKIRWIAVYLPEIIAGVSLVTAIIITSVNVFTRYVLRYTYAGSDEIVCMAFAWVVFPGAAAAFRRGLHYGIDLAVANLQGKAQKIVGLATRIAVTTVVVYVTYLSVILTKNAGTKLMMATQIPYSYFDASMVVGFGLMSIYSFIFLRNDIKSWT